MGAPPLSRGLIFLALTALCLVWQMAALGTKTHSNEREALNIKVESWSDIWYQCSRTTNNGNANVASCVDPTDKAIDCTALKDRVRAIRAFYIFTAIFCLINVTVGVMDFFGVLKLPGGLKPQIGLIILAAIVIVMSMLSWAIAISYPRSEFCNNAAAIDGPNFKWGASPFMMLMLFITAIVQLVLAIIFPNGASDTSDPQAGGSGMGVGEKSM